MPREEFGHQHRRWYDGGAVQVADDGGLCHYGPWRRRGKNDSLNVGGMLVEMRSEWIQYNEDTILQDA